MADGVLDPLRDEGFAERASWAWAFRVPQRFGCDGERNDGVDGTFHRTARADKCHVRLTRVRIETPLHQRFAPWQKNSTWGNETLKSLSHEVTMRERWEG